MTLFLTPLGINCGERVYLESSPLKKEEEVS